MHGGKPAITISSPEQWKRPIEEEKRLINELIDKGIYSLGSIIKEFEEEFREFTGCEYCLTNWVQETSLLCRRLVTLAVTLGVSTWVHAPYSVISIRKHC